MQPVRRTGGGFHSLLCLFFPITNMLNVEARERKARPMGNVEIDLMRVSGVYN